ncbi:hypothetical protein AABB24_023609, partial [Solanum stoloniferum]
FEIFFIPISNLSLISPKFQTLYKPSLFHYSKEGWKARKRAPRKSLRVLVSIAQISLFSLLFLVKVDGVKLISQLVVFGPLPGTRYRRSRSSISVSLIPRAVPEFFGEPPCFRRIPYLFSLFQFVRMIEGLVLTSLIVLEAS